MKRLYIFVLIFSLTFLAACFNSETRVVVTPRGNGEIQVTLKMKRDTYEKMVKMFAKKGQKSKKQKMYKMKKLKANASAYGEGVKFIRVADINTKKYVGYVAYYSFEDINKISISKDLKSKTRGEEKKVSNGKDVTFNLTRTGKNSTLVITIPDERDASKETESKPVDKAKAKRQLGKMKEIFNGMRIALIVEVKGSLIKTDGDVVHGNAVTLFDIDFTELTKNEKLLMKLAGNNAPKYDDMKVFLKGIPGIAFESKEKISVTFK